MKNKICFIICTNNTRLCSEAVYYIRRLIVPENFEVEIITIESATSICSGYNEAMMESDAKYKVYLHQDTFIINRNFIFEIVSRFENPKVGLIGICGATIYPENAISWKGYDCGRLFSQSAIEFKHSAFSVGDREDRIVEAVDGFLIATQYDIKWREDIFKKWDYYDASQCFEFRKRGYDVVVPVQDEPWCIHFCQGINLKNYYNERRVFLKEYF